MVYSKLFQDIHKAGGEERQETQENKPLAIIQDSTQSRINQLQYLIDNRYVRIYEEITEEEFNLVFQKGNSDFGGREELKELRDLIIKVHRERLYNYDFTGTNLQGANLRGANLRGANLREANLREANLREANLRGAYLRGTKLQGACLWQAKLPTAKLERANLEGANLGWADLFYSSLEEANLREADLKGANLNGANLEGVNLSEADLRKANLEGVNLSEADLRKANLQGADLYMANLAGAIISEADFDGSTTAPSVEYKFVRSGRNTNQIELYQRNLNGAKVTCIRGIPASLPEGYELVEGEEYNTIVKV